MTRRRRKDKRGRKRTHASRQGDGRSTFRERYARAITLAIEGEVDLARCLFEELESAAGESKWRALARNDLAALQAVGGDCELAARGFAEALSLDAGCEAARQNLRLLQEEQAQAATEPLPTDKGPAFRSQPRGNAERVALVSFLFNWPSTGGGIVHTVELARFLSEAGYAVQHFYARYPGWGLGKVEEAVPFPSRALGFEESDWNLAAIKARFREAVDAFDPDHVILTDSWNIKPHLADAVRGHAYLLRFQAMECFCPLNNVRLLAEPDGRARQCGRHQLASPDVCARCVAERGHQSGGLHQAERALSGVGTPGYHDLLLRSLREAKAVLVVNPLHEAMLSPYSDYVRVVTSGMDPARFPWPWPDDPDRRPGGKASLLFAGLVEEWMKGFHVLHEACCLLWQRRQDFELVATGDPPG
jgi:hypothetical protein